MLSNIDFIVDPNNFGLMIFLYAKLGNVLTIGP